MIGQQLPSSNPGYWVEPFIEIMRGVRELTHEEFSYCAETLYQHRLKGNPFPNPLFPSDEEKTKAIQGMRSKYVSLQGNVSLLKRAELLTTVFMKTLAQNQSSQLNIEQMQFVIKATLPGALNACQASDLLEIREYKNWLIMYRLGCTQPSMVEAQMDLYADCSDEDKARLLMTRGAIGTVWYNAYKEKQVMKKEIQTLCDIMKKLENQKDYSKLILTNPILLEVLEAYKKHSLDFPPEKSRVYWHAMVVALTTFLSKV